MCILRKFFLNKQKQGDIMDINDMNRLEALTTLDDISLDVKNLCESANLRFAEIKYEEVV